MNIYSIAQDSAVLNQIGYAIDTPERIKLQMGLLRLTETANSDQLLFWGKIFTQASPYYIAVAIDFKGHYAFPHKKFYFATDNFNFKQLPALDEYNKDQVNKFNALPFTGNPTTVLNAIQEQSEQKNHENQEGLNKNQDEQQQERVKLAPKNYTQEDRLAYAVRAIQVQCQVAPKGAYKMIAQHQIRYNDKFKSLKQLQLQNFVHFRYPLQQQTKNILQSPQSIFRDDIFDPIKDAFYWSVQPNTKNDLTTIRNLSWPGYLGYVFQDRNTFGGVYYGNGIKNVVLAFYF